MLIQSKLFAFLALIISSSTALSMECPTPPEDSPLEASDAQMKEDKHVRFKISDEQNIQRRERKRRKKLKEVADYWQQLYAWPLSIETPYRD